MVPFRLSRREIRRVFALTALFFFAAYLSRFVSFGFTHDSLQIDQSGGALFQISLGRFMQPLYWLIRGDIVMPYVVGLLAFAFHLPMLCPALHSLDARRRLRLHDALLQCDAQPFKRHLHLVVGCIHARAAALRA